MAGSRLFIYAAAMIAFACPAWAQVATSSGSRVVMDPETRQTRVINPGVDGRSAPYVPSYQPAADQEPIVLRKPRPHKRKPKVAVEAPQSSDTSASQTQPVETPPAETPAEAPQAVAPSAPSSLGAEDYDSGFGPATPEPAPAPKPVPKKVVEKPKPKPAPKPEPAPKPAPAPKANSEIPFSFGGHDNYSAAPQQQAVAAPQPVRTQDASSIKQVRNVHINFPPGAAEPSADVAAALQSLAGTLTTELQAKSGRLLLQAFAGAPGDKSSEARRLSLKRALAVRQLLIDSGVPSDRIDVRAMGGTTDAGKPDRVDIMLHT